MLLAVVVVASFWLGNYTHDYLFYARDYLTLSKLPSLIVDNAEEPRTIPTSTTATGTLVSSGPVKVTAIAPASITVQTGLTKTETFAISNDTVVYSAVLPGKTARGLGDITVGTMVIVHSTPSNPGTAVSLAFVRDPSLELAAKDGNLSVAGKVTKLSGSEVTITPEDGAPVTITLDASTKILTVVTAGIQGKGLSEGAMVVANGLDATAGRITAKLITIAPTVSQ